MNKQIICVLILCLAVISMNAKTKRIHLNMSSDSIYKMIDESPNFGMFHETYFATGISAQNPGDRNTADAKFQVSIRQRLFKSYLPKKTILFMTYTQKSFWDIYAKSSPFADNNYNPGLTLMKPIFSHDQFKGAMVLSFEHESNGRDSIYSRSWDYYFALSYVHYLNKEFYGQVKVWKGSVDQEGNPDLMKYKGYGLLALNYMHSSQYFGASFVISPTHGFSAANTTVEINFRPSLNANQYFFLQWYNGYAEGLLDYNIHSSMIRFGICFKSPFASFF